MFIHFQCYMRLIYNNGAEEYRRYPMYANSRAQAADIAVRTAHKQHGRMLRTAEVMAIEED